MRIFLLILLLPITVTAAELPTSETAIIGRFATGPIDTPVRVDSQRFDTFFASATPQNWAAEVQVRQFFRNGGSEIEIIRLNPNLPLPQALSPNLSSMKPRGLAWIPILSDLGLLLIPELSELPNHERNPLLEQLRAFAESKHFTLILDPPSTADTVSAITEWRNSLPDNLGFATLYYPQILVGPAAIGGGSGSPFSIGASGSAAARIAQNDSANGIWNPPAGLDLILEVDGLAATLNNAEIDQLNSAHINVIRDLLSTGIVLWGARTLDQTDVENRYLPAARAKRWIAHSLQRSLAFAAFEENNPALWSSLRSSAETFLQDLYVRGALLGTKPEQAYFARCDATTTTAGDIQNHRANVIVGIALLAPAEFYIETISLQTLNPSQTPPRSQPILGASAAGELTAFYSTAPGFHFTPEQTGDLLTEPWTPGPRRPGDGSWQRLSLPLDENQGFLRIRID